MINSANNVSTAINFTLSSNEKTTGSSLPPKLIKSMAQPQYGDAAEASRIITESSTALNLCGYKPDIREIYCCPSKNQITKDMKTSLRPVSGPDIDANSSAMRVTVQNVQNYPKLQTKHHSWQYHPLVISETNSVTTKCSDNNKNNINEIESALKRKYYKNSDILPEQIDLHSRRIDSREEAGPVLFTVKQIFMTTDDCQRPSNVPPSLSIHRTEDQESAFRRIEDVHNYAKLDYYNGGGHSNGGTSSSSSSHEDEEECDDDDDEDDDFESDVGNNLHTSSDVYFRKKRHSPNEANSKLTEWNAMTLRADDVEIKTDTDDHVDVEALQSNNDEKSIQSAVNTTTTALSPPDHHARRPMNAFLIFCKRHRAIVKERYKSLENRAITKILGDWWASLDATDKKSFTNLAQQNKDAFFSANPNFKWYKLPAPPLRTLSTRPNINERLAYDQQQEREKESNAMKEIEGAVIDNKSRTNTFFKLADETQMGELSTLIRYSENKDNSLQETLGETTHFLSSTLVKTAMDAQTKHITLSSGGSEKQLQSENCISSSNSGDEDNISKKKTSRSCKGRIYQELINSGQIAAVAKKVKAKEKATFDCASTRQKRAAAERYTNISNHASPSKQYRDYESDAMSLTNFNTAAICGHFNLDEKIKELPALNLDVYLQRKRNTKKRRKFNPKKRNTANNSSGTRTTSIGECITGTTNQDDTAAATTATSTVSFQQTVAVGSQKRKARKESITRRDVNAIENEVASLFPITSEFTNIKGCYYFNEIASTPSVTSTTSTETAAESRSCSVVNSLHQNAMNDTISTASTSDLLILAEVAANCTAN